ncbi:hypothetical protein CN925_21025, partial [Bacillus sp. AFS055030]
TGVTGVTGPTGQRPTLTFAENAGTIAVFPPINTEVTIVSITQAVLANQQLKIDYATAIELVVTANWTVTFQLRLYRDATLIDTRVFNTNQTTAGTHRFQFASTQVAIAPANATSTYSLRVIFTTSVSVTSASAINRDMNIITFTP